MAKALFYVFLTQIMANGFWLASQNTGKAKEILFLIPIAATAAFIFFVGDWIVNNWDKE